MKYVQFIDEITTNLQNTDIHHYFIEISGDDFQFTHDYEQTKGPTLSERKKLLFHTFCWVVDDVYYKTADFFVCPNKIGKK